MPTLVTLWPNLVECGARRPVITPETTPPAFFEHFFRFGPAPCPAGRNLASIIRAFFSRRPPRGAGSFFRPFEIEGGWWASRRHNPCCRVRKGAREIGKRWVASFGWHRRSSRGVCQERREFLRQGRHESRHDMGAARSDSDGCLVLVLLRYTPLVLDWYCIGIALVRQ